MAGEGRLDFEDGVDAFGGDVGSGGVGEEQRGMELVEDGDVDLAGAAAVGVDDEGGGGSVAVREIAVEQVEPVVFGGGSGGGGVFEEAADGEVGEHLLLDSAEDLVEVDLAGVFGFSHAFIVWDGWGRGLFVDWDVVGGLGGFGVCGFVTYAGLTAVVASWQLAPRPGAG